MNKLLRFLPLALFVLLIAILFSFLDKGQDELKSVLLNKDFPDFSLTRLSNQQTVSEADLVDLPSILNVWATWCVACRVEHPFLMKLKKESTISIYGLNYKDDRDKAINLLNKIGDPYEFSIFDQEGKLAIDLGVYGAPETFLLDRKGVIRVRHVGVLTPEVWEEKFRKALENLDE